MNKLLTAMKGELNNTTTENGAPAHVSTLNAVLDLFSRGAALKGQNMESIRLFKLAYAENPYYAMKTMFYLRDIRGGQGCREPFKVVLKELAKTNPDSVKKNFAFIAEIGRYDDFYALADTQLEADMFAFLAKQFESDMKNFTEGKPISLLAKWLKSENTSSKESVRLATKTRKAFQLDSRTYRKVLSQLRAHIDVVEKKMSANKWSDIKYQAVPSQATKRYKDAFKEHDPLGYGKFLTDVENGKQKINAGTLYPVDLYKKVECSHDRTIEAQWNALPNYIGDSNTIVLSDVSGSMDGTPMDVSVSLGIYISERSKGAFKDHFITFSEEPSLHHVVGSNLHEKISNCKSAQWGGNTDMMKAFKLILDTAVNAKLTQEDFPQCLVIISDMQFDRLAGSSVTTFNAAKKMYEEKGFKLPNVVFWNVNAHSNSPVTAHETGTALVSGYSPSIFQAFEKFLKTGKTLTPLDLMIDVLNGERYKNIVA